MTSSDMLSLTDKIFCISGLESLLQTVNTSSQKLHLLLEVAIGLSEILQPAAKQGQLLLDLLELPLVPVLHPHLQHLQSDKQLPHQAGQDQQGEEAEANSSHQYWGPAAVSI